MKYGQVQPCQGSMSFGKNFLVHQCTVWYYLFACVLYMINVIFTELTGGNYERV